MRHPKLAELEALEPKLAPHLADRRLVSGVGLRWDGIQFFQSGEGVGGVDVALSAGVRGSTLALTFGRTAASATTTSAV